LRKRLAGGLTVFTFHEITDAPSPFLERISCYTSPGVLREQLEWISDRFEIIGPRSLRQFGGTDDVPRNAAVITFDDSWAGVFREGLPILASLGVPALCFVNMATVNGMPDLGAVRHWERHHAPDERSSLDVPLDADGAAAALERIVNAYGPDSAFASFQGATASLEDLRRAEEMNDVWFGSHLYHHWDVRCVSEQVLLASIRDNAAALQAFDNPLPALATPYGRALPLSVEMQDELGIEVVFTGNGWQNRDPGARVIDRLILRAEPSGPKEWWWSTHRRRFLGPLPSNA
jgi:peptidoglycan/xylan/chitin deacetylase (PgdA/CDA1 family)